MENKKGSYSDKIHHGEVLRGASFLLEKPSEQQNLAAKKGIDGAKNILSKNYKKK